MPTRIVLTMELIEGRGGGHDGPALQAALLNLIDNLDTDFAEAIHGKGFPIRPYSMTTSSLEEGLARVEIGILADELTPLFLAALDQLQELETFHGARRYRLLKGDVFPFPYEKMAREIPLASSWTITILSPFMQRRRVEGSKPINKNLVLPEPAVFLPRLDRILSLFAAGIVPPSGLENWCGFVAIKRIKSLRTERHLVKTSPRKIFQIGAVGTFTLGLLEYDDSSAVHGLSLLLSLANFSGIGDRVTVGMGHVRCVPVN